MAKETTTAEVKAAENKAPEEQKFPYDVLAANCLKLFDVTRSTFEGATIGMEGGEYTKSEMKRTIDAWMNKTV